MFQFFLLVVICKILLVQRTFACLKDQDCGTNGWCRSDGTCWCDNCHKKSEGGCVNTCGPNEQCIMGMYCACSTGFYRDRGCNKIECGYHNSQSCRDGQICKNYRCIERLYRTHISETEAGWTHTQKFGVAIGALALAIAILVLILFIRQRRLDTWKYEERTPRRYITQSDAQLQSNFPVAEESDVATEINRPPTYNSLFPEGRYPKALDPLAVDLSNIPPPDVSLLAQLPLSSTFETEV